jgi:hypothetical protein
MDADSIIEACAKEYFDYEDMADCPILAALVAEHLAGNRRNVCSSHQCGACSWCKAHAAVTAIIEGSTP